MDAHHIQKFLEGAGEEEMAQEVMQMSNRLDAFADGLDKSAMDCAIKAAEEAVRRGEVLERQVSMLREALKGLLDATEGKP